MKQWWKLLVAGLIILAPVLVAAAPAETAPSHEDEGVYIGGAKTTPRAETSPDTGWVTYPEGELPLSKFHSLPEREPAGKAPQEMEQPEKKKPGEKEAEGRLSLRAEPGDGLVSLHWTATDLKVKQGTPPLRFTLFYGTEPGRYDKKQEIGTVTEYKLRELKNHQVYFVKVQGYTRDNSISIFSNEERVIPLPAEDLGSPLEKSFAGKAGTLQDKIEADPLKRKLKQFGYDFFRNNLVTGTPIDTLPVGDDYVIGPGDTLRLDIWGSIDAHNDLTVSRNGEITIPKVGVIKVWGLRYGQAKETINRAISRYFKGYELNVTLGRLRTIQVFVVGEVEAPGTYSIGSLGTVVNALTVAGGPSKNGSLRSIRVMRGGRLVQDVDLYDLFLTGDRSKDIRLENGDTVFVNVIGPVVAVAGEVRRPAIFELKGTTSLATLLAMAGGVTAAGDTGRIQVERFEGNSTRIVQDMRLGQGNLEGLLARVEVRDRDMVKVFPVFKALREVVTLEGNVVKPGEYQYRPGMKLTDLIPGFAALLPETHLASVKITRLALPDYHREVLSANLAKALAGDSRENIPLQEQDSVKVFSRADMEEKRLVSINGEVVSPGNYDYYDNMTVRDLITAAGSLKRNALLEDAELTRIKIEGRSARSVRLEIDLRKALAGDPQNNVVLQPNDSLIVRGIPDWLDATDRFVKLKGEVVYPGTYSISKGEKLSSVIARAGGFTDKSYLRGAKFTRVSVKETQQKRMEEMLARAEQDILKKQGELASLAASREELEATKASLEGLMKSTEKLKSAKAEGRVVIRLTPLEEFRGSPYDVEMRGGDVLEVPQTPNVVNVLGQVFNPTTFIYMPGQSISYYLKKAGGPTRDADDDEMYVLKADGSVASREQSSAGISWNEDTKRWTFGGFLSTSVEPGDTLVVPQKLERIAWMREIKDITTILSQIALTAGVIVAAGL